MDPIATTTHLEVDDLDAVHLAADTPEGRGLEPAARRLGWIDRDPRWPEARLGPEPSWYLTELAELLDAWAEAHAYAEACRAEAVAAYERGIGAR